MKRSFHALFRLLVPILCCCMFCTALTGIIVGFSDRLWSLPAFITNGSISIHQGAFLGDRLSSLYVLSIGLGVFVLGVKLFMSGRYSLFRVTQPLLVRILQAIALILIIPIVVCVETGVAYRLGTNWFEISQSQSTTLLAIHSGIALGTVLGISYVSVAGLGLIVLAVISLTEKDGSSQQKQLRQKQLRQSLKQKFEQAYLAQDFVPSSVAQVSVPVSKLAIAAGLFLGLSLLYWFTSVLVVAIAAMVIIALISASVIWRQSTVGRKERQTNFNRLDRQEAESTTMLKAIPDSMLRMTQDGICLSYMPAKEVTHFVLEGDIIERQIDEFMAPEIAMGLIDAAQISLQTGKTQLFQFPIYVDNVAKPHEARITNLGQTEVLVLVREIEHQIANSLNSNRIENVSPVKLHPEADLCQMLETAVRDSEGDWQTKILVCLTAEKSEAAARVYTSDEDLLQQAALSIDSSFPQTTIFLLEERNLVLLVENLTIDRVSVLVDELHRNLQEFFSAGKDTVAVEFKIGLLEIDPHHADTSSPADFAIAMVDAAKATCHMAKQKVNLKTFW